MMGLTRYSKQATSASGSGSQGGRTGLGATPGLLLFLCLCAAGTEARAKPGYPVVRIKRSELATVDAGETDPLQDKGSSVFRPRHLFDSLKWSVWCAAPSAERGKGHRIRVEFPSIHYVAGAQIINGDIRSPRDFKRSVQTRSLLLRYEGGERALPLQRKVVGFQDLDLPAPVATRWIELEVRELHPGGKRGPCFSEIVLLEPRDLLSLNPELQHEIEQRIAELADPEKADAALERLEKIGPPASPWLLPVLQTGPPGQRDRIVELVGRMGDPHAAPALEKLYRSVDDPELRRRILETLRALKSTESVPFLVEVTKGDDRELARAALLAMEGFGDQRTLDPFLKAVIYEDEELARVAIRHLAGFGEEAYKKLLPYLRHSSIDVRARATWAMGRVDHPSARKALMRYLTGNSPLLALAAIRGLGETGSDEAFDILVLNVSAEDTPVREAVADALGSYSGNEEAAGYLGELAKDPEPEVRRRAFAALGRVGPAAVGPLLRLAEEAEGDVLDELLQTVSSLQPKVASRVQVALLDDKRAEVRARALALIDQRGPAGLEDLIKATTHSSPRVRFASSRRLAELGEAGLAVLTRMATSSEEPSIRQSCYRAITRVGSPLARETIARGLQDENAAVRREALSAATRIPWAGYGPHLEPFLRSDNPETHLLAVEAAGTSRAEETVPVLIKQLESGHKNSIRIIWALGRIGDARALPILAQKSHSQEAFTRQQAVSALGGMQNERAIALLMEAMLDRDPMVRKAAERALQGR